MTIYQCHRCQKGIAGKAGDPVTSMKSLGWKNFHFECAMRAAEDLRNGVVYTPPMSDTKPRKAWRIYESSDEA